MKRVIMILAASLEFDKRHNSQIIERPSDNDEVPSVSLYNKYYVYLRFFYCFTASILIIYKFQWINEFDSFTAHSSAAKFEREM